MKRKQSIGLLVVMAILLIAMGFFIFKPYFIHESKQQEKPDYMKEVTREKTKNNQVAEESSSTSPVEEHKETMPAEDQIQAVAQSFIATFFSFDKDSLVASGSATTDEVQKKMALESNKNKGKVSNIQIMKITPQDENYRATYQFKRTLEDKETNATCTLIFTKQNDTWLISSYEWSES